MPKKIGMDIFNIFQYSFHYERLPAFVAMFVMSKQTSQSDRRLK